MREIYRSSSSPVHPEGEGWPRFCAACDREVVCGPGGACPTCGGAPEEGPPTVALPAVPVSGEPAEVRAGGLGRFAVGWLGGLAAVWGLVPALLPVYLGAGVVFAGAAGLAYSSRLFVDQLPQWTYNWGSQVRARALSYEWTGFPGDRRLALTVGVQARHIDGERLDLVLRLRGPDGHYLRAAHPKYAGEHGEVRVHCVTRPVSGWLTNLGPLRLVVPLRAMALPPTTAPIPLTAEILLGSSEHLRSELHLPVRLEPAPGDFPALLPVSGSEDVELLPEGEDPAAEPAHCPLCGEGIDDPRPVLTCSLCDAPHHAECWDFAGGCTTFACPGGGNGR